MGREMKIAEAVIVKHEQSTYYKIELQSLTRSCEVKSNSSLRKLNPEINADRILVVGGRLEHANISLRAKHPFLLPSGHKKRW